jgi:hypothetical protein
MTVVSAVDWPQFGGHNIVHLINFIIIIIIIIIIY